MFGTKMLLRTIPDGKANGLASEASHFYQTLEIRSQLSIANNIHAQVQVQCKFINQEQQ